tara:strand:+ start:4777 stop:5286 length:510 start_codon:yes stop_codon:yes gene_type:complete
MAEALDLKFALQLVGSLTNAQALTTPSDPVNQKYTIPFSNGTAANQGNMLWHDQRTIAASGTENLDMAGSLVSEFGTTITFTVLKGIVVYAATANTNNVDISRPSSNGLVLFAAASDKLAGIRPGGLFAWIDPSAAGLTVTAGSGDLLTFTNSAGSTGVTYDVWLFGEV